MVKVRKESLFQAHLSKAINIKRQKKIETKGEYSPSDSFKPDDSPLRILTIGWGSLKKIAHDASTFKINPQPIRTVGNSPLHISGKLVQKSPTRLKPGHKESKSINNLSPTSLSDFESGMMADSHFSYQVELANREKALTTDFEKRLKSKLADLKGEEKRYSRQLLILLKKACMILGCLNAEHFLRRELGINMAIMFKRYDTDREFWKQV
jgi:hypothetical protein